jgi:16S rRNA (cytosine967-C5)-methyltransferase
LTLDKARETALKIIYEINEQGAYSNIALNRHLAAGKLSDIDRAFITEIVYGSVKWRLMLDRVIAHYSNIKMGKLSPWIVNILRMGVYQLLHMTRVPASAACNESVKLATRYGHRASAGFVNAVLRKVAKDGADAALPSKEKDFADYLSVKYSYPGWLVDKFIKLFGPGFAESLLDAGNAVPEMTVRANTLRITVPGLIERLNEEGVEAVPGRYASEAVIIKSHVSVAGLKAFQEGLFQVQDESSMLVAGVLAPMPGERVLDACSAPGGKTTHIAQLMKNRGIIIAGDIHRHKLKLVDDTASRLGIDIIKSEIRDAAVPDARYDRAFDRVLLDAPCTGLGIIRRKPDIKWARETKDIDSISALQKKMLKAVSESVKPGGVLVYCTCTILPEENEEIITDFLQNNPGFAEDDIAPYLPAGIAVHAKGSMLQIYPNRDGMDGFFIARLKRV